jgi:hypothetical protein
MNVHRPRVLVGLLVAIALVGGLATVLAANPTDRDGGVTSDLGSPREPRRQVTDAELEEAVAIAGKSVELKAVLGSQGWRTEDGPPPYFASMPGRSSVVALTASWETPISLDGPWRNVWCMGARIVETHQQWSSVTQLRVWIDIELDEFIGVAVSAPFPYPSTTTGQTPPQPQMESDYSGSVRVLNSTDNSVVLSAANASMLSVSDLDCPDGFEERES